MQKKIAILFLISIFAIGIVACGSNESATSPTAEPAAEGADASSADADAATETQEDAEEVDTASESPEPTIFQLEA